MKKITAAALLLFCFAMPITAQKMLLLEKYGRAKTTRIYPGETLKFKLKNHPGWYERELTDVLPDQKSVVMDLELVRLEDIDQLRVRRRFPVRAVGSSLLSFSASLVLYSAVALAYDRTIEPAWLGIGAATTIGGLVMARDKGRRIRLGERHRLRALEVPVMK